MLRVRICAGGGWKQPSLPRYNKNKGARIILPPSFCQLSLRFSVLTCLRSNQSAISTTIPNDPSTVAYRLANAFETALAF